MFSWSFFFLVGDVESVKTNAVYTCIVLFLPFKRISVRGNKIVPNITQEVNSQLMYGDSCMHLLGLLFHILPSLSAAINPIILFVLRNNRKYFPPLKHFACLYKNTEEKNKKLYPSLAFCIQLYLRS